MLANTQLLVLCEIIIMMKIFIHETFYLGHVPTNAFSTEMHQPTGQQTLKAKHSGILYIYSFSTKQDQLLMMCLFKQKTVETSKICINQNRFDNFVYLQNYSTFKLWLLHTLLTSGLLVL